MEAAHSFVAQRLQLVLPALPRAERGAAHGRHHQLVRRSMSWSLARTVEGPTLVVSNCKNANMGVANPA